MQTGIVGNMGAAEWRLPVSLSEPWRGSFFFEEVARDAFGPFTIVLGSVEIAALTPWLIIAFKRLTFGSSPPMRLAFLCMGAIDHMFPFRLIVWRRAEISGSHASILNRHHTVVHGAGGARAHPGRNAQQRQGLRSHHRVHRGDDDYGPRRTLGDRRQHDCSNHGAARGRR